ncbi:MAG TPA: radical SAM protein [Candidatus Nanoarchaeia archaeon]|nr:radical SAM protein [Candidatus Nanoarchaeia archaeon]
MNQSFKFDKKKDEICIVSHIGQFSETWAYFPIGIAMISGALKKVGYKVRLLDLDRSPELKDEISRYKIIMFSLIVGNSLSYTLDKIEELKSMQDKTIIVGGPLVLAMPQRVMEETKTDFLIHGDAEDAIVNLIKALETNNDFSKVMGVGYRKNGKVVINQPAIIEDLDTLPLPDMESYDMEAYIKHHYLNEGLKVPSLNWYSSRGCTFDCQFCFHDKNFRGQSAKRVVKDLKYIMDRYGVRGVWFFDDNFMNSTKRVEEFCELVKPLNLRWGCEARATSINENIVRKMKDAGCVMIRNGLESGSDRMLEVMNKGAKVKHIKNAIRILTDLDMPINGGFMFGVPTETVKDAKETLKLIRWIYKINPKAFIHVYYYTPRPATPWYDLAVKQGMKDFTLRDWINIDKYQGGLHFNMSKMTEKQVKRLMLRVPIYKFLVRENKFKRILEYVTKKEHIVNVTKMFKNFLDVQTPLVHHNKNSVTNRK